MHLWAAYKGPIIATAAVVFVAWLLYGVARLYFRRSEQDRREQYRKLNVASTVLLVLALVALVIIWAMPLQRTGTFLGLIGAGVAIALKEPLLSIAGRIAILWGHMFRVGDRIEINKMKGDVIDIGFFYTLMMEIGNWINGDQASGRIVQFSNSQIFGTPVFNYTANFRYIWDELMLPVTYSSNVRAAAEILLDAGREYTREFLQGAHQDLERMRQYFLVSDVELDPQVYFQVTSNWLQLNMRYVVDPKKRRAAQSFIFDRVFAALEEHKDIQIGSDTMDLTVHQPEKNAAAPNNEKDGSAIGQKGQQPPKAA